jgi:hypothetical protein
VLNASVRGVKGCLAVVGVRGGTFVISHGFSPGPSDVGDPSRRLISSLAALRFSFCSLDGNIDQMPRTRLMNKSDLCVLSVYLSSSVVSKYYSQHENCYGKGRFCLHAVSVVSRGLGIATAFPKVPRTRAGKLWIGIVWPSLTVYTDGPERNEDHIRNDAQ